MCAATDQRDFIKGQVVQSNMVKVGMPRARRELIVGGEIRDMEPGKKLFLRTVLRNFVVTSCSKILAANNFGKFWRRRDGTCTKPSIKP